MAASFGFLPVCRFKRYRHSTVENSQGKNLITFMYNRVDVVKVMYYHQVFPSIESFLEAFHNGTIQRRPDVPDPNEDFSWSTRRRVGAQRDLDNLPGPRSVSFAGLRFRVDRKTQYISWMGWGLYLGFDRDMGLSLWDVRIKGERIIYQVCRHGCFFW
jgi:primary-amine oxidase